MAINYYMSYIVWFTDLSEYNFAFGLTNGTGNLLISPAEARSLFGIPNPSPGYGEGPKGIQFNFPYMPGQEIFFPNSTGIIINENTLSYNVPSQAGNPPSIWPANPNQSGLFQWSAIITRAGALEQEEQETPIPQRRWIDGRELGARGEGSGGNRGSRDGSRTLGDYGSSFRSNNSADDTSHLVAGFRPGLQPKTSWERFYVRLRVPPSEAVTLWRCRPANSINFGCRIMVGPASDLQVYDIQNGNNVFKGTAGLLAQYKWYLIDVLLKFDTGVGTFGKIKIFINHEFVFEYAQSNTGMGGGNYHFESSLGTSISSNTNPLELDTDDWICADIPANVDSATLEFINEKYSADWFVGSHIRAHFTTEFTGADWAGSVGAFNQAISVRVPSSGSQLTSSTPSAKITGLTDVPPLGTQDDPNALILGPVSALVSTRGTSASGSGKLGYKVAGSETLFDIGENAVDFAAEVMYNPSGLILPQEFSPFSVVKQKSDAAASNILAYIQAEIEYLGIFGPEDAGDVLIPANEQIIRAYWKHNANYANTPWGVIGPTVASPVYIMGGTYTGNGTYQEVTLPAPCHFLFIRKTSANGNSIVALGASIRPHLAGTPSVLGNIRIWTDILGVTKFSVNGTDVSSNANETVYQFIAFCDPGARFCFCGSFDKPANVDTSYIVPVYPFFPNDLSISTVAAFVQVETTDIESNGAGLYYQGPGFTAPSVASLQGATVSNGGGQWTGLSGVIDILNDLLTSGGNQACTLFRVQEENCEGTMFQVTQYTGDAQASRVIPIFPLSGRYPIFVMVIRNGNGTSFFKDPSHIGTNCSTFSTLANEGSGILSVGIDSITVGSNANANGVVYSVFAFPGSNLGMLNGIYFNGMCPPPTFLIPDPDPLTGVNVISSAGLVLSGETPTVLLKDLSGIYTLIKDKHNDTMIDRQEEQTEIDLEIPDPIFKTGFIGG